MQRCNCDVRLGGDIGNTVPRVGVSPAEIVILRHQHGGDDAVINIQPTGMDKMPHAQERDRLKMFYGDEVVNAVFPGSYSKLPVTLKEIMPPEPGDEDEEDADAPAHELEDDDRELIEKVLTAKSKAELRDLALANEVNLDGVPEKMDDMQKAIITGLFPNYRF